MSWLKSVAREILGLFVDDSSFAIVILIWLIVAVFVLPHFAGQRHWTGVALFVGVGLILAESVLRASRRRRPRK
jgi:hypothetical protein